MSNNTTTTNTTITNNNNKYIWQWGATENDGSPVMSDQRHHAISPLDALEGATGPWVFAWDSGEIDASRRHIVGFDATDVLRAFARRCALDVIDLWDAPQVVRDYLERGDESLRDEAYDAARAAARASIQDAVQDAARAAARAAAINAAQDAAWDAARAVARAAARAAAINAAQDVVRAAALNAAINSAWDAAWTVAWDEKSRTIESMILSDFNRQSTKEIK